MNVQRRLDQKLNMDSSTNEYVPRMSLKRSRKVTFGSATCNAVVQVQCRNDQDQSNIWYSQGELRSMRSAVKIQAKQYRVAFGKITPKATSDGTNMSSLVMPFENSGVDKKMRVLHNCGPNASFRGLEPRIFVERQRNRIIAYKTVLEYQRRTLALITAAQSEGHVEGKIEAMREGFAVRLGDICSQLSAWSRDEAISSARHDATGVYGRYNIEKMTENYLLCDIVATTAQRSLSAPTLRQRPMNKIEVNDEASFYNSNKRRFRCITYSDQEQIRGSYKRCTNLSLARDC